MRRPSLVTLLIVGLWFLSMLGTLTVGLVGQDLRPVEALTVVVVAMSAPASWLIALVMTWASINEVSFGPIPGGLILYAGCLLCFVVQVALVARVRRSRPSL